MQQDDKELRAIVDNTIGVAFYGTPHRGYVVYICFAFLSILIDDIFFCACFSSQLVEYVNSLPSVEFCFVFQF